MPISSPKGWTGKEAAFRDRAEKAAGRQAIRAERIRLYNEQQAAAQKAEPPPPAQPQPSDKTSEADAMTSKQLRDELTARGYVVPASTAKTRLVELYTASSPPPAPTPRPPDTVPSVPGEK